MASGGWINVSDHPFLTPRFEEFLMQSTATPSVSTRSASTFRASFFRVMPPALWSIIFRDLDSTLSSRKNVEQKRAQLKRMETGSSSREAYSNSNYHPLTEFQFWRSGQQSFTPPEQLEPLLRISITYSHHISQHGC